MANGYAAEAGLSRGQRPPGVIFVSATLGGALLSFGGAMFVMVGGGTYVHEAAVRTRGHRASHAESDDHISYI